VRGDESRQGLTQAGVGQPEVVIHLEQYQRIPHTRFALTERIDPASDGRHALTDIEIEPVTVDGRIAPATSAAKPCVHMRLAEPAKSEAE
jgi:hypothetical protein